MGDMKETRGIMGMPITVEIPGDGHDAALSRVFGYFAAVDERFSTYKSTSEITAINRGELAEKSWSAEMREVFALAERTKEESRGYFDIRRPDGLIDPSGIVKGLAIKNAAKILAESGISDYFIDAGGDIALAGLNSRGQPWSVGIRNPFKTDEIVQVIRPRGAGVATSGSYLRGAHIYDPHHPSRILEAVVSITVIGPDVLEADRFATAAFAMGRNGIGFIESLPGFEGYMIDSQAIGTETSGFSRFIATM